MSPKGTSQRRLLEQCDFIKPYVTSPPTVLEIGCATGELAETFQSMIPTAQYQAIEISPAGQAARSHVHVLHERPLRHLISAGDVGPASFDLIIMSHVLEHLVDVSAEVAAIRTVLRPHGALFVEVPNGSGNRALPFDDNISHAHFFSPTSLLLLLAAHGLAPRAVTTGARLDTRYSDSLRVIAMPYVPPAASRHLLSDHPKLEGLNQIAVWGAGTVALEFVANFFDPNRIAFFVDNAPEKHDGTYLGRPVHAPTALLEKEYSAVLISSFDFADAIGADLRRLIPDLTRPVIRMEDLL